MSQVKIKKVAICGFGLIGGCIARDIRRKSRTIEIVAYDRRPVLQEFMKKPFGKIRPESDFHKAVKVSDIIILSAPHKANEMLLKRLARSKSIENCLILDTGAVKSPIAKLGGSLSFAGESGFVPTHPMAGREKAGFQNSAARLFEKHAWYIADDQPVSKKISRKIDWLLSVCGAEKVEITAGLHDELVSEISHLPQLISTILGGQVNPNLIALAGPGLKSMLRLAGSPYSVWSEIISENKDEIIRSLKLYRDNLSTVIKHIERDESLADIFKDAKRSYTCLS